jgi:hypothetical protein
MDASPAHSLDVADDLLEAAFAQATREPVGAKPPVKVSYTHDAVIDFIIAHPEASQGKIAAHFGYTPAWMSIIINSDAFQARLRERKAEIIDPTLVATARDRFQAVLAKGQERLLEILESPSPPPNIVTKAIELGARGLDVGGFGRTQVNLPPAQPAGDHLVALAKRLVSLQRSVSIGEVYEAEVIPSTQADQA